MSKVKVLSAPELRSALARLPNWITEPVSIEGAGALRRDFVFKDFRRAFAFMTAVALEAEKRDHHPEWSNVYNRVSIVLRTHDANDMVSHKDVELALAIDELAGSFDQAD